MRFVASIGNISYYLYSAVMLGIGLGVIILAFMNPPIQFQIVLGLIGLGFIVLGLMQVKREHGRKTNEERFNILMTKLSEIQQRLDSEDQSKGTGIAVADVITSGLKFYAQYMNGQQKDD